MSYTDDFFKELNKKNKKNKKEENDTTKNKTKSNSGYANKFYSALNDDIAPLPSTATRYSELAPTELEPTGGEKDSWFKTGGFSDGVDGVGDFFGDLGETVAGTVGDLSLGMVKGVGRTVEGIVDLGTYAVGGVGGLLGFDDFKEKAKKVAQYNATDEWTKPATDFLDQYSVLGNKADMVSEGLGQVAAILLTAGVGSAAGLGSAGVTALTTGVTGLSSMGTGIGNAYNEDANDTEAFLYGLGSGAIEAGTELLSGGLGKAVKALGISRGIGGLDDIFAKKLSSTIVKSISNESVQKVLGNTIEAGVKAGGEGLEEVLSGLGSAVMKWLTYEKDEDIKKLIEDEDLLEQFVVGAITSSIAQGADYVKANKSGRDFVTGYTNNEQAVIDKEVEKRVSEKEKNGKKLSNKEIGEIEDQVRNDMEHGQLNIETIEEVLGGEKYTAYKDTVKNEEALKAEYDRLADIKKSDLTTKQEKRLAELEAMNLDDTTKRNSLRKELNDTVFPQLNNSKLAESYKEIERQDQKFEVDLTKYKGKQREAVERAVKSGVLNNTYRSHVLVDTLSRIEADKGITFDYTNNKKLKESGFAVEGVRVNGYANKSTGSVTLNVQSHKAWQSVVGHEITHILKDTKHYTALKDALFAYAESKGELANRRTTLTELYQNLDADVDEELTADLVGDYLFTDKAFIDKLTGNRTLFQKIYDEIKYLCKVATGKELTEIEKVKHEFDMAWKEISAKGVKETGGKNQYSLSSMANTFYGDENMSSVAFEERNYKQTDGYKNYVNQCVNNMRQTRADFDEAVARKEIEDQIDGIVRVALAAKKAGYDIHDDAAKREKTDSKKRLLFSSLEPNSDYFTSSDISTICDKRQNFAEIYDDIVRAEEAKGVPRGKRFFDNVDNYFYLHKVLADKGLTQPCRQCYVESMRKNLAPMANAFLRLVNETDANNKANDQLYQQSGKNKGELKSNNAELREKVLETFDEHPEYGMTASDLTVETLTTEDGLAKLKIQAPLIYEAFNSFYGQSKPKMPKSATPFRFGELTALLTDDNGRIKQSLVNRINSTGGFRLQSYSDFQIQNYTDVLQVIFEAGTLGLNGHAYTKVPAFLEATDGTNLKRNISIFMYKDGNEWKIDRNDSFPYELDEIYDIVNSDESGNTSIIAVSQNKEMSAWVMANDNVGMGIPFHKSGMKMGTVRDTDVKTDDGRIVKGYSGTIDHTKQQTEVWAKASADHKALTKVKKGIDIYSFWDFDNKANLSKNELIEKNLKAYIDACDEAGYLPKFRDYVMNNGSVLNDVLRFSKELGFVPYNATIEDISFEYKGYRIPYGYYKFLVDFGIFKPDGSASPHETLSLKNYDFDKAVEFFGDSEKLRRNEILQQFANGEERRKYRDSNLSAEELAEVINQKRKEVVNDIVAPTQMSLSKEGEQYAPVGDYSTPFNELAYNEDVAPVMGEKTAPVTDEIQPMTEDEANAVQDAKEEADKAAEGLPKTRRQLHRSIIERIKSAFKSTGSDFDEVLKNAKDLSTFATVDNTPQRVMEKALGYKEGQTLADLTVNKVAQNETAGIKWLNSYTDRKNGLLSQISKQYRIKPESKESAAAQMYAEGFYVNDNNDIVAYGDAELAQDFPDVGVQYRIKGLAHDPRIRQIYDETLDAINASRTRNGYPEIQKLDNYFLHFRAMDDTFSRLGLPFNPNDIRAKDLPTDLNGVTADLKPGQPYFASAMHRKGKRTSFDLLGGLERYLTSAKNQIYHIDDIQTLRALRNYIADTYGQANGLEGIDTLSEEEAQERIKAVYNSHLSTFAKFLNEEANILAGKTALIDRGLEGVIGRRGMTFLSTVQKQTGSNMVGFNISSSLTNFLPVAQALAKTNKLDFLKAFAQTISNKISSVFGKNDGFAENSPVMIRRKGADRFYRTPWQKASDAGYVLMSAVDNISTELIARTKFNELTRKGMDEQTAHFETDKWVSRLMGDRSLGQMPQLYNSKTLGFLTQFQLEVRNQLDSQFYDTIQEAKVSNEDIENALARNAKTAAKVASTFVQLAVAQHLFGKAFESVAGYNPAFDIISVLATMFGFDDEDDSEDTVLDNIEQGFFDLLEDLPYTSTFTGGRIPIASALPIKELIKGEDSYGNEKSRLETLKETAPYYVLPGGYGQLKKTYQGLNMFSDEHPVSGSYTDSGKLRFPVEDTTANRVQAAIFGQYASENAREYFDNDYAPMDPGKYAVAKAVGGYSAYKTYSSELYDIKSDKDENGKSISGSRKEKVIDYINNLDADYYTKIILFKSEYPSDDTYNADIVNYVINSDFTYDEKASILTELGFRVTADGEIYAD